MPESENNAKTTYILGWLDYRPWLDGVIAAAAYMIAHHISLGDASVAWQMCIAFSLSIIALNFLSGSYRSYWRYVGMYDAIKITSVAFSVGVSFVVVSVFISGLNAKIAFSTTVFSVVGMLGLRCLRRLLYETNIKKLQEGRSTLVIGTNSTMLSFVDLCRKANGKPFNPVGIVAESRAMLGKTFHHLKVVGTMVNVRDALVRSGAKTVVASRESLSSDQLQMVMQVCHDGGAKLLLRESKVGDSIDSLRKVNLEDLLPRRHIEVDLTEVNASLSKKVVMVTGGGGSIGSELCRQIAQTDFEQLVVLDHSEFNLFQITQELGRAFPAKRNQIIPVLGDVKSAHVVYQAFDKHRPNVVFHAAAYKHVHLVELNPCSAILNNVMGTLNVLKESSKYNVEKFVLISTDKAVNPTSVMGATKRICELMVCHYAVVTKQAYSAVRFGNVLGSSGSLIPILSEQIARGGPVTVTDEGMTRYFMTIPEAVKLVLMASTISNPGDVNILKMGKAVKIVEVARNLILLMGKSLEEVPIIFTGAKPGEKLFEELYLCGNESDTKHPDIVSLPGGDAGGLFANAFACLQFEKNIEEMVTLALADNNRASKILMDIVLSTNRQSISQDRPMEVAV